MSMVSSILTVLQLPYTLYMVPSILTVLRGPYTLYMVPSILIMLWWPQCFSYPIPCTCFPAF